MEYLAIIVLLFAFLIIRLSAGGPNNRYKGNFKYPKEYKQSKKQTTEPYWNTYTTPEQKGQVDYTSGYKSKWMFSYNEKNAFNKIKAITDEMGLYLFAKVRLFDLIEPKEGIDNKKAHQWKIQAKHVDFVICDKKLVARAVIELDDASHDKQSREERDNFVNAVLSNCGYKVIHLRNIEADKLKNELETIFSVAS